MRAVRRAFYIRAVCAALAVLCAHLPARAHTSIAVATDDVRSTIYAAYQQASAAAADASAIEGCRASAVRNGVPGVAQQCAVVERQSLAGFGALVCGDQGCGSGYGASEALASTAAMQSCQSVGGGSITNCSVAQSQVWQDENVGGSAGGGPAASTNGPAGTAAASAASPAAQAGQSVPEAWQRMLDAFMTRTYGPFNARRNCWPYVVRDKSGDRRFCMRGMRSDWAAPGPDGRPTGVYVLAAGDAIDAAGKPVQYGAAAGMVAAFYAERVGDGLVARSELRGLALGHDGEAPKEWELVAVSPTSFGYRVEVSQFTQGFYVARSVLLVRRGTSFVNVGFPSAYSNAAQCTVDDTVCVAQSSDLRLSYDFDTSKPATPLYPLLLHVSGKKAGRDIAPRTLSVPFDGMAWKYVLPKDPVVQEINAGT